MKHTLLIVFALLMTVAGNAQDTIRVKTLTFEDITKRSGTWLFPPPQSYEKVWLEYTLKCDPRTTQDNLPCGEWDYLTYTVLTDSTGEFDSTLKASPNFRVRGSTPASFGYVTDKPLSGKFVRYKKTVTRTDSSNVFRYAVGNGIEEESTLLRGPSARTQFVWTKDELMTAGVKPGNITGIRVFVTSAARNSALNLAVRMRHGVGTYLYPDTTLSTVYNRTTPVESGMLDLQFHKPFVWNGTDGITIDFSVDRTAIGGATLRSSPITTNAIGVFGINNSLLFTQGDKGTLSQNVGDAITNQVTVAFWCYGDPEKLPRNLNIFEATDVQGRRILNSHLPWSNGKVYWDAGMDPQNGSYDRIEADAPKTSFAGRWNHWAFVKNASTGVMRIYQNGKVFLEGTGKTKSMNGIKNFVWGSGGSASFEGRIDDFGVWNRALDSASIARLMTTSPAAGADPNSAGLQCYYNMDADSVRFTEDASVNGRNSKLFGLPTSVQTPGAELRMGGVKVSVRPDVVFEQGTFTQTTDSVGYAINTPPKLNSVERFPNVVQRKIYRQLDAGYPDLAVDTISVYEANTFSYTIDEYGKKIDSTYIAPSQTLTRELREWFTPVVNFEIGRFITPYGIGLDLGPKGFKWIVDMTDYAPLLRNNVTLSAGNQQELIDMTFVMIKGTPPRNVVQIDQLWYDRGAQFPNILTGTSLPPVNINLQPLAKTFKLKSVASGHDFSNETNCAEFCIREHFISINNVERFKWDLWKECGDNPVYPQGGTWPIDRAGWCPGAPVDVYEFNATPFISGTNVTLDYGVKKKAVNENWGRWEVATQLFGYSSANRRYDVAVTDVIRPSDWEFYQRLNPVCGQPRVIIQNTGSETLTACTIKYGAKGFQETEYAYNGNLAFLQVDTIDLPTPVWPTTEGKHRFVVTASQPNGIDDEYEQNNSMETGFVVPPTFFKDVQIILKTNNQAAIQYEWKLKNVDGTQIASGKNLVDNRIYTHDFTLENGCYDFELINNEGYGLDFWFLRSQLGSGSLSISSGGQTPRSFNPDFGNRAWIQFRVGAQPTVQTSADTLYFNTPVPAKVLSTIAITSANSETVRVDSVNVFSTRGHFSVQSSSKPWPFTLRGTDTVFVTVAFDRPDDGTTSGTLRVYSNDVRSPVKFVKLLGTVGTTGVEEFPTPALTDLITLNVIPNPISLEGNVELNLTNTQPLSNTLIAIHDVMGRTLFTLHTGTLMPGKAVFPVPQGLAVGTYSVVVRSVSQIVTSQFVVAR